MSHIKDSPEQLREEQNNIGATQGWSFIRVMNENMSNLNINLAPRTFETLNSHDIAAVPLTPATPSEISQYGPHRSIPASENSGTCEYSSACEPACAPEGVGSGSSSMKTPDSNNSSDPSWKRFPPFEDFPQSIQTSNPHESASSNNARTSNSSFSSGQSSALSSISLSRVEGVERNNTAPIVNGLSATTFNDLIRGSLAYNVNGQYVKGPETPIRAPRQPRVLEGGVPRGNFSYNLSSVGVRNTPAAQGLQAQRQNNGQAQGPAFPNQGGRGIMQQGLRGTYRPPANSGQHSQGQISGSHDTHGTEPQLLGNQSPAIQNVSVPGSYNQLALQLAGVSISIPGPVGQSAQQLSRSNVNQAQSQGTEALNVPSTNGTTASLGFHPMTAVRRSKAVNPENDPQKEIKVRHGISPNYGGDASIARNHSADIPHTKNCSLWITNLPPHCTHNMLLSQIQGMGRIYCCVINPPQQSAGHSTAAAKVVFFELSGAQNFYTMCSDPRRRLIVGGMVARVSLNRIKSAEFEPYGNKSRVLLIQGNVRCVNEESLTAWFKERFQFDKDEVITHFHNSEMGLVEFRFGSWRCQAEAARIALLREYEVGSAGGDIWSVRYGIDPCSV